jgi:hypothetical protein
MHVTAMIIGAAIGALVTYITKDDDARKTVGRFIDGAGGAFKGFVQRITPEKTAEAREKEEMEVTSDEKPVSEEPEAPPAK